MIVRTKNAPKGENDTKPSGFVVIVNKEWRFLKQSWTGLDEKLPTDMCKRISIQGF
jgi:hypothetical protein